MSYVILLINPGARNPVLQLLLPLRSYFHRYRQKEAVSDYNLMTRQLTTTVLQSKKLNESNKNHILSAGILNTPLPYHTPISSQEVG